MHLKKLKGNVGLTKVIANIVPLGFNPSLPICDHLKYDLIIEKDGICKKAQVKYTKMNKKCVIETKIQSCWSNKKGNHTKRRIKGDYDILCIYCPDTDDCYFLADSEFISGTAVVLRTTESKTLNPVMKQKARMAEDFKSIEKAWSAG